MALIFFCTVIPLESNTIYHFLKIGTCSYFKYPHICPFSSLVARSYFSEITLLADSKCYLCFFFLDYTIEITWFERFSRLIIAESKIISSGEIAIANLKRHSILSHFSRITTFKIPFFHPC